MRHRVVVLSALLLTPLLLVLLFILIFKPHEDDLQPLRPYIQSEYVEYYDDKLMPGKLFRLRELTLYGMPRRTAYQNATDILSKIYARKPGWYPFATGTWMRRHGGFANIFGRLDVTEWYGHQVTPFPEDQLVPDTYPFYFSESGIAVTDWREEVWARATGKIRHYKN